jgi:hypothetical protein
MSIQHKTISHFNFNILTDTYQSIIRLLDCHITQNYNILFKFLAVNIVFFH